MDTSNDWDKNDYDWLDDSANWHGDINGCYASVFYIHGKMIREQRHIPYGSFPIAKLPNLIMYWAEGLANARLEHHEDTGDGDSGWWIEGERPPNEKDAARLEQARQQLRQKARRDLQWIHQRYPDLQFEVWNGKEWTSRVGQTVKSPAS